MAYYIGIMQDEKGNTYYPTTSKFTTISSIGYTTDSYGNFIAKSTDSSATWCVCNKNGNSQFYVSYTTGNTAIAGNLTVAKNIQAGEEIKAASGRFFLDSGGGKAGVNMSNSDIANVNAIIFNDYADAVDEGIAFPKSTASWGSTTLSDYDIFKIKNGMPLINELAIVDGGTSNDRFWVRFSNGIQICSGCIGHSITTPNAIGALWYGYVPKVDDFIKPFKSRPHIVFSHFDSADIISIQPYSLSTGQAATATSTGGVYPIATAQHTSAFTIDISYIAIGWWK